MNLFRPLGYVAEKAGTALHLPELGISERLGVHDGVAINGLGKNNGAFVNNGHPGITLGEAINQASSPTQAAAPGGHTTGGGSGATYAAQQAAQLGAARQGVQNLLSQMDSAYNSLFGVIDQQTQERRGQLDQNYNDQFAQQDKNLENAQNMTNNMFADRGTANSSANAVAQGQNVDQYNLERNNLLQDRQSKYAELGQKAQSAKSSLQQNRPQYDLSQYNDVNQLNDIRNQLDAHIKSLQAAQQNDYGTQGQYVNALNAIAPAQSNLQAQLADKLTKLAGSSAPASAKLAIAKGYIKMTPGATDADIYKYLPDLLTANQQPAGA